MTFTLDNAFTYDCETFPNAFTLHARSLYGEQQATWEISEFKDDRQHLMQWFNWLAKTQSPMIGFNNLNFDYPVIHFIFHNPNCTVQQIYQKAMSIINSQDRFGHMIWANDRFAPQIDIFKIYHMDNKAKSTSLKALQINMRSESVVDMPVPVGTTLTQQQIEELLIPYNIHDVDETHKFILYSIDAINFRISLIEQFGIDVLNWPDTKIGSKIMESKLGDNLCYDSSSGRKKTRQTPRSEIALRDIIFPYISFENPEFQRIHQYLTEQVLKSAEITTIGQEVPTVQTKGVFTNLKAHVGGLDFYFGTGGIHGSVSSQKVIATDDWLIRDIDVASLYPSIAIVNRLSPAHLGERFVEVYSDLPKERKKWQQEKGKKCVEANTLKLASNGVYGNSNNPYSVFYDPQFTLTITVNGQLMLCMLAERLVEVPSLRIIQINTDGITYYIHESCEPQAEQICREWEQYTLLTLEDAGYSKMWIRDVNNYIAQSMDGSLKLKGAYWTPDSIDYHKSISDAQPPSWHKDLGNLVSIKAATAYMIHNVPLDQYIKLYTNPYDFMCRIKVGRNDKLLWGEQPVQKTTRFFVSKEGRRIIKISPPTGQAGSYKKKNGVSDSEYNKIMTETNGQWDERVCTKNKSQYKDRVTNIIAGHKLTVCNDVKDFDFNNLNYDWYIAEAEKLIIR